MKVLASPLYIYRPLLNGEKLREWAKSQGLKTALAHDDFHVTQVFSKEPVPWGVVGKVDTKLVVSPTTFHLKRLGKEFDVLVIAFDSQELKDRWVQAKAAGCSSDWPNYTSHVTITYNAAAIDETKLVPPDFALLFGGEVLEPIDDDFEAELAFLECELACSQRLPYRGKSVHES